VKGSRRRRAAFTSPAAAGTEDWDVERRHQIPLRDSSGFSPDSMRPHRVIDRRLGTLRRAGKDFFPDFRFSAFAVSLTLRP
jgi:hypothetical protein